MKKFKNSSIFLDRDGTLNVDHGYVCNPEKIQLLDGIIPAIQLLKNAKYKLFLFTNQSGVSLGKYTKADVDACNNRLVDLIGIQDCFTEICIATEPPSQEKSYNYRKPSPRFILEMIKKYNLDPKKSYMVGDKDTDALAGIRAGINAIYLATGAPPTEFMVNIINSGQAIGFPSLLTFAQYLTA
ncbi:MAG: HAD-IIIA family hydrolase [Puniceicoccales bacterium]|jgi:D-glycero-D-manno-heptose 1,7-bisphosphate phosphatase|nr:HAD-IIIA family hydrolase [Puniceicoccales bacterium]